MTLRKAKNLAASTSFAQWLARRMTCRLINAAVKLFRSHRNDHLHPSQALPLLAVPMSDESKRLKELRNALADYIASEGCSCCQNTEAHDAAADRLGKLLRVKRYEDDSGYDFYSYRTQQ
jgi:hypothetical protein